MKRATLALLLHHRRQLWSSVALGSLTVSANVALMAVAGYLIAKAATHPPTILLLWVPIVSVRFFGISRAVFRYSERLVSHNVTLKILTDLRTRFYHILEPRWPAAFSKWTLGELLDTMMTDIDNLQNVFLQVLSPLTVALLASTLSITIVASLGGVHLAFVLGAGLTAAGAVFPVAVHRSSRRWRAVHTAQRSALAGQISDIIVGMTDLIMSEDSGQRFLSELETRQKRWNLVQLRLARKQGSFEGLVALTAAGTAWVMLVLAVPRMLHGELTGVMLCVITLTALASFEAVLSLSSAFAALGESMSSLRRLEDVEKWPIPAPDNAQTAVTDTQPMPPARAQLRKSASIFQRQPFCEYPTTPKSWHIQARHISFAYGSAPQNALTDVSFDVFPGKRMAIVGHNGAGKSTLIYLLTRLWDVQTGAIEIDGVDVRQMSGEAVRQGIAVVSPLSHVFHASLADNLRIAQPTASTKTLHRAAQAAQLLEWIAQLPKGYDTLLGDTEHIPSQGQRQRIAIARAILADARVFLLDEPLESLDAATAIRVDSALAEATLHKTTILITHQLRTLGPMDEILVLHEGRVVERGKHEQLLARQGQYRQMWEIEQNMLS